MKLDRDSILRELQFNAVRSSGSGGQHVNKTATKVELQFNIETSQALNEEQKSRLLKKLSSRLTTDSRLILSSGDTRSQHTNKEIVIDRFFEILENALKRKKKRKATKISYAEKQKRLEKKKRKAEKKANRKPPEIP